MRYNIYISLMSKSWRKMLQNYKNILIFANFLRYLLLVYRNMLTFVVIIAIYRADVIDIDRRFNMYMHLRSVV